jgi:hypothetical protein
LELFTTSQFHFLVLRLEVRHVLILISIKCERENGDLRGSVIHLIWIVNEKNLFFLLSELFDFFFCLASSVSCSLPPGTPVPLVSVCVVASFPVFFLCA